MLCRALEVGCRVVWVPLDAEQSASRAHFFQLEIRNKKTGHFKSKVGKRDDAKKAWVYARKRHCWHLWVINLCQCLLEQKHLLLPPTIRAARADLSNARHMTFNVWRRSLRFCDFCFQLHLAIWVFCIILLHYLIDFTNTHNMIELSISVLQYCIPSDFVRKSTPSFQPHNLNFWIGM